MHGILFRKNKILSIVSQITLIVFVIAIFLLINLVSNSDGAYSKEINTVVLFTKNLDADRVFYVSSHEIGHYIYFKKLTQEERNNYNNIFIDSNNYISEYSKTNAAENFAEEFAARISCYYDHELMTSDERNNYFDNIVKPIVLTKTNEGDINE